MKQAVEVMGGRRIIPSCETQNAEILTIGKLSKYLSVSPNTIYSWISRKKIPYIKLGRLVRFNRQDIDKWVQEKKVEEVVIK
jgi:excisionase family DNA binding protein